MLPYCRVIKISLDATIATAIPMAIPTGSLLLIKPGFVIQPYPTRSSASDKKASYCTPQQMNTRLLRPPEPPLE